MPFPRATIDMMEKPGSPDESAACADVPFENAVIAHHGPWLSQRFGFIGSAETFDLLRYEVLAFAITPKNMRSVIEAGLIDVLVLEHAIDDLGHDWGTSFFDWNAAQGPAREVMELASAAQIPRVALCRGGAGYVPLFEALARQADHVIVTDAGTSTTLAALGVSATFAQPAMQPALYNAFSRAEDHLSERTGVFSLDLGRATEEPSVASTLESLVPFGLALYSADRLVTTASVSALGSLATSSQGTVTSSQLRVVFRTHDVLVQIARPGRDASTEIQHALHAAACRCAVIVLGELQEADPRHSFAQVFATPAELRGALSRMAMDRTWAYQKAERGWRYAHKNHPARNLVGQIARSAGFSHPGAPQKRVTVLAFPSGPDGLSSILMAFRSQEWQEKELVVVALTDRPEEWPGESIGGGAERIVFVPERFGVEKAWIIGVGNANGDYLVQMDQDDLADPNFLADLAIASSMLIPDTTGDGSPSVHSLSSDGRWARSQKERVFIRLR